MRRIIRPALFFTGLYGLPSEWTAVFSWVAGPLSLGWSLRLSARLAGCHFTGNCLWTGTTGTTGTTVLPFRYPFVAGSRTRSSSPSRHLTEACVPSQKGLSAERPQRQSTTRLRAA